MVARYDGPTVEQIAGDAQANLRIWLNLLQIYRCVSRNRNGAEAQVDIKTMGQEVRHELLGAVDSTRRICNTLLVDLMYEELES